MSPLAKLTAFAAALAALFGGAALAGAAIGPEAAEEPDSHATGEERAHGHEPASASTSAVRGLGVADAGLRIVVDDPELRRGRSERLAFRIVDERGETVREFDVGHAKRMHLILVRRDLTAFQHLHPNQTPTGAWVTGVRLDEAGSYRLFADFSHNGRPRTLATDLRVDGPAALEAVPAPRATAVSDGGYDVRLQADSARADVDADLRFLVTKDGVPVTTEPYLGAGGHLVALREGDLAFLHVHLTDHGYDDAIGFAATFPTQGRYRLFLQFKHEGRVHTAAFTREVH